MSSLTKSKIAYDLNISPHRVEVEYPSGDIVTFIFSSALYRGKFIERLEEHRREINSSLSKRFGFDIVQNKLSDLKLYITIEKRGFLLYKGPVKIECLNDIILDGNKMMLHN